MWVACFLSIVAAKYIAYKLAQCMPEFLDHGLFLQQLESSQI